MQLSGRWAVVSFSPFEIGPFRVVAPMGAGGMGEVFRAVHTGRNFPVALKIMSAERARDPELHSALRREIRAVARLHHPGIIMVFDCGEVPERLENTTDGRFVAGSSWLAMELATYSLEHLDRSSLDWWQVRNIFVRILDALSHSHARGVIHRDLKPGNVLFVEGGDGRFLKLTDFGLAHALEDSPADDDGLDDKITGTPRFMSPEQITGRWRDHGPWTDLYALGCLAFWLIEGNPPFHGEDRDRIMQCHLEEPLPPLHADFEVPPEFGRWLGRLLAKRPGDRFQRAADAARALFALGDPAGQSRPDSSRRLRFESTLDDTEESAGSDTDMGMTEIISDVIAAPSIPDLEAVQRDHDATSPPHVDAPVEVPGTWHRQQPPPLSAELIGVGLGLFGLREIPFVDRQPERDELWEALRTVAHTSRPRLVVVRGATGTGKSRLATWICERAHEVGSATPMKAAHSPMGGAHDGLGAMFASFLRCGGLDREEIIDRVRHRLPDDQLDPDALHDCLAVTEVIAPAVLEDYNENAAPIRFHRPDERYAAIFRYLQRLARQRPLILLADDLQWGNETLNALEYLLEDAERQKLPLLVIGTVQTDALVDRPVAREKIDQLCARDHTTTLDVGPLAPPDQRRLVRQMLRLEDALVEQVVERTDGNPLYAVQLVDDWVERGLLQMGGDGFRLREDTAGGAALPHDLQQVFRDRLARLVDHPLDAPPSDTLLALELAAVLGTEVSSIEWSTVCSCRGVRIPTGVLEQMVDNDLAANAPDGWRFTHQAFRRTLIDNAARNNRLQPHHRGCARMLADLYPADHPELPLRLARHLIAAGRAEKALRPLLDAAAQARVQCDFELASKLYDQYQQLLDELNAAEDDPRRARAWLHRAKTINRQGEYDEGDRLAERAESTARKLEDTRLLADALLRRARVANRRGAPREGMELVREARPLFERLDDSHGRAMCLVTLADLHYWTGDYHRAESNYLKAIRLFDRREDLQLVAKTEQALGSLYTTLGDQERALSMLQRAREVFEDHGDLRGVTSCLNNLGEIYRRQGRLDRAEKAYQQSRRLRRRVGIGDDMVVVFNLGMVRLAQDRLQQAIPLFAEMLELVADSNRRGYLGLAHVAQLPGCVHRGDWDSWDHHLQTAREHLGATGFADNDLATLAEQAGRRALDAGATTRAKAALELARSQWLQMGRQDRAADIDRVMPHNPPS